MYLCVAYILHVPHKEWCIYVFMCCVYITCASQGVVYLCIYVFMCCVYITCASQGIVYLCIYVFMCCVYITCASQGVVYLCIYVLRIYYMCLTRNNVFIYCVASHPVNAAVSYMCTNQPIMQTFITTRVGQNRSYSPYMAVNLMTSLQEIPYRYTQCIHIYVYTFLANPLYLFVHPYLFVRYDYDDDFTTIRILSAPRNSTLMTISPP